MAPTLDKEAEHIRNKARKELLGLLEGVSKAEQSETHDSLDAKTYGQVRGKKNLVVGKDLTNLLGLFVQFSTLKEYGVDKVFELENGNTDSSQRNIVYLVHGENASLVQAVAGKTCWFIHISKHGTLKRLRRPPSLYSSLSV